MCSFLVRRYLIRIVQRARRLEVSCGGMDLCTAATDLSARSYHIADGKFFSPMILPGD
jgi:hypothetical protein